MTFKPQLGKVKNYFYIVFYKTKKQNAYFKKKAKIYAFESDFKTTVETFDIQKRFRV